jgi:hypothetical protein
MALLGTRDFEPFLVRPNSEPKLASYMLFDVERGSCPLQHVRPPQSATLYENEMTHNYKHGSSMRFDNLREFS